jgi:hypothetical protein
MQTQRKPAMNKTLIAASLLTIAATAALAQGASAPAGEWKKEHPRRAEVNARLAHQDHRINKELKEGEITKSQAGKLHREDRQIRQEERDMASQNGGHITKAEQKVLNQQENKVSKEIGK